MTPASPVLHLLCGKIAAGKSTLAARLAAPAGTILLSEDAWLEALFSDQMTSIADYVRCTEKLRTILGPHVSALLEAGVSVVLDFPANTVETRKWMKTILKETSAFHQLHVLTTPEKDCLARLHSRNAGGGHPFAATEEQFHQFSSHYVAPSPEEGFNVIFHSAAKEAAV